MDRWTSLAVHCIRPHASIAGSMDLIPGQRSSACHVVWPKKEKYWKDICCCSVMSDSLRPHGLQHPRLPCPSPSPRACSDSCPSSRWCHPAISSCHSLLLLPSIFPSVRVFSNESSLRIRWPKNWSFSFSISPSNEYLGLISFRIDWFDLLVVQVTLNSLLKHHR